MILLLIDNRKPCIINLRMLGPRVHYLFIYWTRDPSQGREVVRGG